MLTESTEAFVPPCDISFLFVGTLIGMVLSCMFVPMVISCLYPGLFSTLKKLKSAQTERPETNVMVPDVLPHKETMSRYEFYLIDEDGDCVNITHSAGLPYCFTAEDLGGVRIRVEDRFDSDNCVEYPASAIPWFAKELTNIAHGLESATADDDSEDSSSTEIDSVDAVNEDTLVRSCTVGQLRDFLNRDSDPQFGDLFSHEDSDMGSDDEIGEDSDNETCENSDDGSEKCLQCETTDDFEIVSDVSSPHSEEDEGVGVDLKSEEPPRPPFPKSASESSLTREQVLQKLRQISRSMNEPQ